MMTVTKLTSIALEKAAEDISTFVLAGRDWREASEAEDMTSLERYIGYGYRVR